MIQKAGYFGENNALYATFYSSGKHITEAVLLILPIGEERKCTIRLFHSLAEQLAKRDYLVCLYDHAGTGSSFSETLPDYHTWVKNADSAIKHLLSIANIHKIHTVGARIGANISLRIPQENIGKRILWEPLISGLDFLDEMIRRSQIRAAMSADIQANSPEKIQKMWDAGEAVEFESFFISADLAKQLQEMDLKEDLNNADSANIHLLKVTPAKELTGVWKNIESQLTSTSLIREKPFWGVADAKMESLLIQKTLGSNLLSIIYS